MAKLFYTMGEVAEMLGESVSLVRFWCNTFPRLLKPQRNAKGNRLFTQEDIDTLKELHHLIKVQGMTLEGAGKKISEDRKAVSSRVKALEKLRAIRARLEEIRSDL